MGQKFAALQSGLAPFHGFDEAVFLLEVTRNNILHSVIEVAALLVARCVSRVCRSELK
jgi:hypothetical protein